MSLSRRGFLEVGALSASGLVLENLVPPTDVFGETFRGKTNRKSGIRARLLKLGLS